MKLLIAVLAVVILTGCAGLQESDGEMAARWWRQSEVEHQAKLQSIYEKCATYGCSDSYPPTVVYSRSYNAPAEVGRVGPKFRDYAAEAREVERRYGYPRLHCNFNKTYSSVTPASVDCYQY